MYMALFTVSVMLLLGFVYWNTLDYVDAQTDQGIAAEMGILRKQYEQTGLDGLRRDLSLRSTLDHDDDRFYLLADRNFAALAGNLALWPEQLRGRRGWADATVVEQEEDGELDDARARVLASVLPGGYHLLAGRDLDEREDLGEHILEASALAIGLGLILALAGGLLMSRGTLRRIETINRTGRSIMDGDLGRRMPVTGNGDEFDRLAINLNAMLDRIQHLMDGMRQVTDNVAHDLRSPLTRLRSRLEFMLLNPRSTEEYRAAFEETLSDVNDVLNTFNALLSIAQAEAGADQGDWSPFDLSELLRDAAEFYEPLAEENGLQFTRHIAENLTLPGNRHLLTQAVGNLLDNAMKYTPRGGSVRLSAERDGNFIEITVCDNGSGIPVEMREKVLERFMRLEASRTTPGNGLGLSLVRAVAQLHGATLEVADNQPGLKVILRLPVSSLRVK